MGLIRNLVGKVFEKRDDRPVALPVGMKPPTEADRLKSLMARLIVEASSNKENETFEESLDFDVEGEDELPVEVSQSEMRYMHEERLLTEAEQAAKMAHQRRVDAELLRRTGNGKDRGGREGTAGGGGSAAEERGGAGGEKRGAGSEEGRAAPGGNGGSGKGGKEGGGTV